MCSRCPDAPHRTSAMLMAFAALLTSSVLRAEPANPVPTTQPVLRICADPNNLPFTNSRLEGFENRIAELIARDLDVTIRYVWRAQRRGFFREALKNNEADVVLGVPTQSERALTTVPYYRSTFVFVHRKDKELHVQTFDDPVLRQVRVGVQVIGDDAVNPPPAHALANRGIVNNVVGFSVYGDYTQENPPARIIDAVISGDIEVAAVWGPLAGYFVRKSRVPLQMTAISPQYEGPALPFVWDISIGVRKSDGHLRDRLNQVLTRRRTEIDATLDEYGVPRVSTSDTAPAD